MLRRRILEGALLALGLVTTRPAEACSGGGSTLVEVTPPAGTTKVSTATSVVVLGPAVDGVTLSANGKTVPLQSPVTLGPSSAGPARSFAPVSMLDPLTTYTVSIPSGQQAITSTFTTGSGYDKAPGTAPVLDSVRFWRVRYPVDEIGAGGCVFSEYVGFVEIHWQGAVIPNTTPAGTLHRFSLAPKHGGDSQNFVVLGAGPQLGSEPTGDHPFPIQEWNPTFDPTQEYCVTVYAQGDGDRARPASVSQTVCGCVEQRSVAGAPPSPVITNGCGSSGAAGAGQGGAGQSGAAGNTSGTSGQAGGTAGTGEQAGAAGSEPAGAAGSEPAGAGPGGSSGAQGGAGQSGAGGSVTPSPSTPDPGSGCAVSGGGSGSGFGWLLLAGLLGRRRRGGR